MSTSAQHASGSRPSQRRRDTPAAASVYMGDHWLVYATSSGDFDHSQMIAPGLALGSHDSPVKVTDQHGTRLEAACLLHAAGQWNSAAGTGMVVLYIDPLDACGHAIQHVLATAKELQAWEVSETLTWVTTAPDALWSGEAASVHVSDWVRSVSERLATELPRSPPVAPQLRRVAQMLARESLGRVNVASLAAEVGWSAEHLRKEFRRGAGVTLSRYQLWRRMLRMVASACEQRARGARLAAPKMILDAGFYDVPHGGRAIRRHFGITSSDAAAARTCFVDCRIAALGCGLNVDWSRRR